LVGTGVGSGAAVEDAMDGVLVCIIVGLLVAAGMELGRLVGTVARMPAGALLATFVVGEYVGGPAGKSVVVLDSVEEGNLVGARVGARDGASGGLEDSFVVLSVDSLEGTAEVGLLEGDPIGTIGEVVGGWVVSLAGAPVGGKEGTFAIGAIMEGLAAGAGRGLRVDPPVLIVGLWVSTSDGRKVIVGTIT
jgi:hypothetical protein